MLCEPKLREEMLRFFEAYGVARPEPGVFVSEVLNFGLAIEDRSRDWDSPYGVCDSLDQLRGTEAWARIASDPRPMALVLTPFRRSDEGEQGWRWHKWGEYVGLQDPQCEYLYDEPIIELVYAFETITLAKGH